MEQFPSPIRRRRALARVILALISLSMASACGQAGAGDRSAPAGSVVGVGDAEQTTVCIRIWNTSVLMPLHRNDHFVPRKLLRAADAGAVYFNKSSNACVATLFYDQGATHAFLQLIYFSSDPDGGPIRLTFTGQDKRPAVAPGRRNVQVRPDGSLALA